MIKLILLDLVKNKTREKNCNNIYYDINDNIIDNSKMVISLNTPIINYKENENHYEIKLDAIQNDELVYSRTYENDKNDKLAYISSIAKYDKRIIYIDKV